MRTRRLVDVVMRSSLIAIPSCYIADCGGTEHADAVATRSTYGTRIDDCLADAEACRLMCTAAVIDEEPADGYLNVERCEITNVSPSTPPDWIVLSIDYSIDVDCMGGRRPAGFVERPGRSRSAASWLARAATVEAASVTAFRRLARTLARMHAPRAMIADARRAVADELRHARVVGALARRMGATVEPPVIADAAEPSAVELARENALEGQVAETLGVLVATCQSRAAHDPEVRSVFAAIARDEARHAALAFRLARWLDRRLSADERAAVDGARCAAIATIADQIGADLAPADREVLGIPEPARLRSAASAMFAELG